MRSAKLILAILTCNMVACSKVGEQEKDHESPNAIDDLAASNFGGAKPVAVEDWFAEVRYPEVQYVPSFVVVAFKVTEVGRAVECRVVEPRPASRFAREEICNAIERRAKFEPARDGDGNTRASDAQIQVRFKH